jgi:hypothetical protein
MDIYRHEAGHALTACRCGLGVADVCGWHVAVDYDENNPKHTLEKLALVIMGGMAAGEHKECDWSYHMDLYGSAMEQDKPLRHGLSYMETDMDRLAWIAQQDQSAVLHAASTLHKVLWNESRSIDEVAEIISEFAKQEVS